MLNKMLNLGFLLVAIIIGSYAKAQTISFVGDVGCAVLEPGPPSDVGASVGNEEVTLTWNSPDNGACVDDYIVDVVAVSGRRHFFDWIPIRVWEHKVTIRDIENGVKYKFSIQAVSEELNHKSKPAVVYATPRNRCKMVPPGYPTNLRASPGHNEVELCWDGVSNSACVDEYRVDVDVLDQESRFFFDFPQKISKGGCVTIQDIENDMTYEFTVQAWSQYFRRGGSSSIVATPEAPWKCTSIPNWYKACEAAASGRCRALSCKEQAENGKCDATWMQEVDWARKTITQYCADYCPCPEEVFAEEQTRSFLLDDHCCDKKPRRPFYGWFNEFLD